MTGRIFIEHRDSGYSDDELDAECRLLGALMLQPGDVWLPMMGLGPHSFCDPFHRAVFYAIMLLAAKQQRPLPLAVWELVKDHPDSEAYGLQQVIDLAVDAADPERLTQDYAILTQRGFRTSAELLNRAQAAADKQA